MVLAGRPYHIDPEICHGINKLARSLGFAVVSEDSVAHLSYVPDVNVVNQWTYHSHTNQHTSADLIVLVTVLGIQNGAR